MASGSTRRRSRPAEVWSDGGGELLRAHAALEQALHEGHRRAGEPVAPEVVDHLLEQLAHVGKELALERQPALEGALDEHALAEAVDGVDTRPVEVPERVLHPARGLRPVADPGGEHGDQRVGHVVAAQRRQRHTEQRADALAQLLGGGHGVGDDEDALHLDAGLQHEPQEQPGDGVRLARAGAGLDHLHAVQRDREQIEGRRRLGGHAFSSVRCTSSGSMTRRARLSNSASSGSRSRQANARWGSHASPSTKSFPSQASRAAFRCHRPPRPTPGTWRERAE